MITLRRRIVAATYGQRFRCPSCGVWLEFQSTQSHRIEQEPGIREHLRWLLAYPLLFVAAIAAWSFLMAFASKNFLSSWWWLVTAVVLVPVLSYELFVLAQRVRNAALRKAHFQDRFPSLDALRGLRMAWKEPAFRRGMARVTMFAISAFSLSWGLIRVLHLIRDTS